MYDYMIILNFVRKLMKNKSEKEDGKAPNFYFKVVQIVNISIAKKSFIKLAHLLFAKGSSCAGTKGQETQ
jgi:hypothetical protein